MKYILCGVLLLMSVKIGAQKEQKHFARVSLGRGIAAVTLDKDVNADQMIVTIFYRQTLNLDREEDRNNPTTLLRAMVDVQPALAGVGVAINSVEDPSTVEFVRIETVKNVGRMEWRP